MGLKLQVDVETPPAYTHIHYRPFDMSCGYLQFTVKMNTTYMNKELGTLSLNKERCVPTNANAAHASQWIVK